ncbi:MAG: hypothetical protein IRY99_05590, partial [Isosphaeraceae bacterium]|nr:hypothetical protein [Isosphaeraceae bacterium]
ALAARLAAATRPVAREYFCGARNAERYLAVYEHALASSPRRRQRRIEADHRVNAS